MRRLLLALLLGFCMVAAAPWAGAQPVPGKFVRIGVLGNEWWPPIEGLGERLRALGYVEGEHFRIEHRWAHGGNERHNVLAAELVALPVDVIVTWGTPAALAAKSATARIPIVSIAGDLVAVGLVSNYARADGNITGFATAALQLDEKRLAVLKELLPGLSQVAVFINPTNPALDLTRVGVAAAAAKLGIRARFLDVRNSRDIEEAFRAIRDSPPEAIQVIGGPVSWRAPGHDHCVRRDAPSGHVPVSPRRRSRRPHQLRTRLSRPVPARRRLHRPHRERNAAGGPADRVPGAI